MPDKKGFLFFMQKLKLKSIYKFRKNCSSSHKEHSKIGFAIYGFFDNFIWIFQVSGTTQKERKNLLSQPPLESFGLHKTALISKN
jgi:hypothetical protein